MWVCFNDGFVSAVQDRERPRTLVVRARNKRHLGDIFPDYEVVISPDADYACRLFIHKTEFAEILADRVAGIDYDNFKASVKDRRLHRLYADFWYLHAEYQREISKPGIR
ncbi:hypothetical protein [Mesorhizobium argentiipisi]|uniref:Uncharacterized protein n=1 Tax=Mesorhizobium argentiipisi TaxID=3015175 RepID=A0ABU8KN87_9HYPH